MIDYEEALKEQVNRAKFDFILASNYLAFSIESYSFKITSTALFVIMDFRVKQF